MRGPSDTFFKDIVHAAGGELLQKLPEIQKRQAAVKALGQTVSLAELAVKMGILEEAKLDELAGLEGPKTPSAGKIKTPSAGKIKTPSAGKIKTPSAAKVPAASKTPSASKTPAASKTPSTAKPTTKSAPPTTKSAPPQAQEEPGADAPEGDIAQCNLCGGAIALADYVSGKGICPACRSKVAAGTGGDEEEDDARPGTRGTKRRPRPAGAAARGGPPARASAPPSSNSTGIIVIVFGLVIAGLVIAIAVVLKNQQPQEQPSPEPTKVAKCSPSPEPTAVVEDTPSPSPAAPPVESDRQRQSRLTKMAFEAIDAAKHGDYTKAKKILARIRLEAQSPQDDPYVKEAEKQVDEVKKANENPKKDDPTNLDPSGHRIPPKVDEDPETPSSPEPSTDPADAATRTKYRELRMKLDPLFQKLDLDGARAQLAQAPALTGLWADDLEIDKALPDAFQRFLEIAARGARKNVDGDQELKLFTGGKVKGKLVGVDGLTITIKGSQGEQMVKVSELDREALISFAATGLTKDSQTDFALGRGLILYYSGDAGNGRAQVAQVQDKLPLAKKVAERMAREGGAYGLGKRAPAGGGGASPKPEAKPSGPDAQPSPKGEESNAADIAAIQGKIHARVSDEGDGAIGLYYSCTDPNDSGDFEAKGADRWEVATTEKPGTYNKPFTDLECGIASYDDIAILHKIPFKGDVDFTVEFWVNSLNNQTSNLTFVLGWDKKKWIGSSFGQQLLRSDGKSRPKAISAEAPDQTKFSGARDVKMRIQRKGDVVTTWFNGNKCGESQGALGFDGRVGIVGRNLRVGIRNMQIHGTPDLSKLK